MHTRVFEVLEQRGQKQRWLLAELRRRGYAISEGYLSQIKAGAKQPSQQFIEAVSDVMGMKQQELFYEAGGTTGMAGKMTKAPMKAAGKSASKRKDG